MSCNSSAIKASINNLYKNETLRKQVFIAGIMMLLIACKKIDLFERTTAFPKHEWSADIRPVFNFTVTDTTARYNIYIVLRHTDAYHYNNIWLNVTTIAPGDSAQSSRINLRLGDNQKWLGTTMDEIIEHRIKINQYPVKLKQGNYRFMIEQIMRENPLLFVLHAGVRIEKNTQ